jgi:hypothetical protein
MDKKKKKNSIILILVDNYTFYFLQDLESKCLTNNYKYMLMSIILFVTSIM